MTDSSDWFAGFTAADHHIGDVTIHARIGGRPDAPPLVLLHGFPQNHAMWHRVARQLAPHFRLVLPDLRGYGDSSKPPGAPGHVNYSKRTMAGDVAELMRTLGHDHYAVCGHDRGGRVAHRLAVDHPDAVTRLAVIDIAPTLDMYEATDMRFATFYYHWFHLIQPSPLPETMIGGDPLFYLHWKLGGWGADGLAYLEPEALESYERCFSDPAAVHAMCEDYRAAATVDLDHDRSSRAAEDKIACDTLVLWGGRGVVEALFDPLALWQAQCSARVSGHALDGGHFLAEELPAQTASALQDFFGGCRGMTGGPFDDLDDYIALPRVSGLAVSPDGSRVVTAVAELNPTKTEYVTSVWEIDPSGQRPSRRLTRGAKGESAPAFTSDGDLLFTSVRPSDDDEKPPAALWRLPAAGGEAHRIAELPGGITAVRTARDAPVVAVAAPILPSAQTVDDDRRLRTLRKDNKITAILHRSYPVRHWDHDLGPDQTHLFILGEDGALTDVTPRPGAALGEPNLAVSPDGTFAIATWRVPAPAAAVRSVLMRIDLRTGERTVIADDPQADLENPAISPDGTVVAFTRESLSTPQQAPRITLCHLDLRSGEWRQLAEEWDRWPASVTWARDGTALLVTADQNGRCPIFEVSLDGAVRQRTVDDFSYTNVVAAPGGVVYALRTSYAAPPHPVRVESTGVVTVLPCVDLPELPGELTEVSATTADGVEVRSWLVLPRSGSLGGQEPSEPGMGTAPAPLLLWIHGGPLNSWNVWSWRWNPWLMAARGYAVLLPDPALSTGYGQEFIQRGWGAWGGAPYGDLMAAVDAACADPRIDGERTAAMGGSFGGYMANWVAGHTDRFRAIVTHASLWALDQFGPTTDGAYYWAREMTPAMAQANSPHRFVEKINTPMLVIHGDKDYRVPIGEALRLWYELLTLSRLPAAGHGEGAGSSPHRFLYFPSENHWVLSPQHAKIWYQAVTAFLAEHVLGQSVEFPEALG